MDFFKNDVTIKQYIGVENPGRAVIIDSAFI
jgi:hypothetical protein